MLNCTVTSGLDLKSTASIRVDVDGDIQHGVGSGNGGFDAFIYAMNKVMSSQNYVLPTLVDYAVRIPSGGHTDALTECVITWDCNGQEIKTRGVHSNQVFAGDTGGTADCQFAVARARIESRSVGQVIPLRAGDNWSAGTGQTFSPQRY